VGDFRGDGRSDLVVADLFSTNVHMLLGNGDGTFAAATSYAAGSGPSSLALGDFKDDGRLDIAVADSGSATVSVLLQPTTVLLSKQNLAFAAQILNTSSVPQDVTLTNIGPLALGIARIAITGADAQDFSQTDTCGSSVAAQGGSCTITVTFTPTLTGPRNASLTISDNAVGSPQVIPLTGIGVVSGPSGPNATLSATGLTFATQLAGTTSPAQSVTLSNTGTVALSISSIGITGADHNDFTQTHTCAASLAPAASCTINITFTPTGVGSRTALLSVKDNAPGSPQTVSLSGTETVVKLSSTQLFFHCSTGRNCPPPPETVTLTNVGSTTLDISSITSAGSVFSETNNCGSSVAAGKSCTITVKSGMISGSFEGLITISDNGGASPQQIRLFGTTGPL
jgi:hypothetical protein